MPNNPDWKMPKVFRGEVVDYFVGSDSKEAATAWVVKKGDRSLNLAIMTEHARMIYKDGVRHMEDPDRRTEHEPGFWKRSEFGEAMHAVVAKISKSATT